MVEESTIRKNCGSFVNEHSSNARARAYDLTATRPSLVYRDLEHRGSRTQNIGKGWLLNFMHRSPQRADEMESYLARTQTEKPRVALYII